MAAPYPWPFLSQLHADGSGWDDCFQASLGAYLLAAGKFAKGTAAETVLNAISLATRGMPDQAGNPDTDLPEAAAGLTHYGLPVRLTTDWVAALSAPWSILLADGTAITRADGSKPYPASWFGNVSGPDHFVLWGPPFAGSYSWIMNPLDPTGTWAAYDLTSVQAAFNCAYLLDPPDVIRVPRPTWTARRKFAVKATAGHGSVGLITVPGPGKTGIDWGGRKTVAGETWMRGQWRNVVGWFPSQYVTGIREVGA